MKKILILLLMFTLLLTGCKNDNKDPKNINNNSSDDKSNEQEVINNNKGNLYFRYVFNNGDEDLIEEVEDLSTYNLKEATKVGYTLKCWCIDSTLYKKVDLNEISKPTDDKDITISLYASWKINKYTVTFICDDKVVSTQSIEYGKSAKAPTAPLKPGYLFNGWDEDLSIITHDLEVHGDYVENSHNGTILVVLGNYLNDNGTISLTLRKRLELTLEANEIYLPDYIVVTGGLANQKAGITEAKAMYNYLVEHGIDSSKIIQENKSLSTNQNAIYTMEKLEDVDFERLIIVSTIEHFTNYSTISFFNNAALGNEKIKAKDIRIMIYTNNE